MGAFSYIAVDYHGKRHKGVHEAESMRHVRELLRHEGLMPLEITAVVEKQSTQRFQLHWQRCLRASELSL